MMLALIIFLIGLCKLVEKFIVDPIKKKQVLALEKKLEEDKKKKELSKEKAKQSLDSAKNFKTCLDAIVLFMKKYQNDFLNCGSLSLPKSNRNSFLSFITNDNILFMY